MEKFYHTEYRGKRFKFLNCCLLTREVIVRLIPFIRYKPLSMPSHRASIEYEIHSPILMIIGQSNQCYLFLLPLLQSVSQQVNSKNWALRILEKISHIIMENAEGPNAKTSYQNENEKWSKTCSEKMRII